jgi:hypothetical protein
MSDQVDQHGYKRGDDPPPKLAPLAYFCLLGVGVVLLDFQPRLFFGLGVGFNIFE